MLSSAALQDVIDRVLYGRGERFEPIDKGLNGGAPIGHQFQPIQQKKRVFAVPIVKRLRQMAIGLIVQSGGAW